jgi:predicted TIM-barrel fold metal-dependent hydrolase
MNHNLEIVDAHTHIGPCRVYDLNPTWDEVYKCMNANKIATSIIQPLPGDPDPVKTHTELGLRMKQFPGRVFGMTDISPHVGRESYRKEIKRCIKDLGFVGIKLHPPGQAVRILSDTADMVFQVADELNVPLMIHTGEPAFALPSLCIVKAEEYPNLPIILAHAGWGNLADEHFIAAKKCSNIYLETCWISAHSLKWYGRELPVGKLLFGSDVTSNLPIEIFKYTQVGFSENQLEHYLYKNAVDIFKLDI